MKHLLKQVVSHERVALVTHSVLLRIDLAESALLLATVFANGFATALAVALEN